MDASGLCNYVRDLQGALRNYRQYTRDNLQAAVFLSKKYSLLFLYNGVRLWMAHSS